MAQLSSVIDQIPAMTVLYVASVEVDELFSVVRRMTEIAQVLPDISAETLKKHTATGREHLQEAESKRRH